MPDIFSTAEQLQQEYATKLPPVHLWNPPLSGSLDMRIARNGRWFYLGDEIKRHALAKLFSSILKREGDDYFVVTPVEKWKITVEVAPFYIVSCDISQAELSENKISNQLITFTTYTDDKFVVNKEHPIEIVSQENSGVDNQLGAFPLVTVRDEMQGLISREVYYQLVNSALQSDQDVGRELFIWSAGEKFSLGETEGS